MSGTPIGEMRVDLYADIARFVSGMSKASTVLDRWGDATVKTIEHVDKTLEKMGTKLSLKVTAPLIGLAAASLKAADPTGHVSNEIERLGLRAEKALKPVGDVLVKLFDAAGPSMDKAVGYVRALSDRFDGLSDSQKKTTVEVLAFAAAVGPTLIGLSILTTVAKTAGQALVFMAGSSKVLPVLFGATTLSIVAAAGAALLFSEAGRQIYESFKPVQELLADGYDIIRLEFEAIRFAGVATFNALEVVMAKFYNSVVSKSAVLRSVIGGVIAATGQPALGSVLAGNAFEVPVPSLNTVSLAQEHAANVSRILAENAITHSAINRDFAGPNAPGSNGNTAWDRATANLGKMKDDLSRLWESGTQSFDGLSKSASAFAASTDGTSESVERTRKELEATKQAFADYMASKEAAMRIRQEVNPGEGFTAARDALLEQQRLSPELITPEVFSKKLAIIENQFRGFGDTVERVFGDKLGGVIYNFSSDTSQAFAQMAVDGKRSFGDLVSSMERSLVAFLANEQLFKPFYQYAGVAIGSLFGSAVPSSTTTLQPNTYYGSQNMGSHARGGIFSGPIVPFASGGVVTSSRNFAMAGGTGLMGERGPEAIIPLTQTGKGLGVHATQSPVLVNIVDQRGSGARPEVTESNGADGRRQISILIRDEVKAGISDGTFDRHLALGFGLNRRGTPR